MSSDNGIGLGAFGFGRDVRGGLGQWKASLGGRAVKGSDGSGTGEGEGDVVVESRAAWGRRKRLRVDGRGRARGRRKDRGIADAIFVIGG